MRSLARTPGNPEASQGHAQGPRRSSPSVEPVETTAYGGHMLVAISISPSGGDETGGVSAQVAQAVKVIRESGLITETNAMFTNIEGEWDEVMEVVKRAVFAVAETSPRVGLVLKADLRAGHDTGQMTAKVERVEQRLASDEE